MNFKTARVLLSLVLAPVIVLVWAYAFRMPFLIILAGPAAGALAAIAVLVCVPGRRGPVVQLLAFGLYAVSVLGTAGAIAGRILPWPYAYLPSFGYLFIGVHGEGLIGIVGIAVGAAIAATAPRGKGPPNKPLTVGRPRTAARSLTARR